MSIIPIDSVDKFATLKSENKLLSMWSLGLPVLFSCIPSYSRVATEARKQVERFEWELVQGTRTKVTLALALMTLAVQGARRMSDCVTRTVSFRTIVCSADLPMSVMNICMVFIENNTHRVVRLPLAPLMSVRDDANDRPWRNRWLPR